jgi:hypothetical protein
MTLVQVTPSSLDTYEDPDMSVVAPAVATTKQAKAKR